MRMRHLEQLGRDRMAVVVDLYDVAATLPLREQARGFFRRLVRRRERRWFLRMSPFEECPYISDKLHRILEHEEVIALFRRRVVVKPRAGNH